MNEWINTRRAHRYENLLYKFVRYKRNRPLELQSNIQPTQLTQDIKYFPQEKHSDCISSYTRL